MRAVEARVAGVLVTARVARRGCQHRFRPHAIRAIGKFTWYLGVPGTMVFDGFMLAQVYTFEVHNRALCLAKGPVPLAGSFDKKRRAGYDAGQFEEAGNQKCMPALCIRGE